MVAVNFDTQGSTQPLTTEQCENFLNAGLFAFRQRLVMRWGREDLSQEDLSELRESDMEHIGTGVTLIFMIRSFLENIHDKSILGLDWAMMYELFVCHDTPEILVGDARIKTDAYKIKEAKSEIRLMRLARKVGMSDRYANLMDQYYERVADGSKSSGECNFVKTVDEMVGLMVIIQSKRCDMQKRTFSEAHDFFDLYAKGFPALRQMGHHIVDHIDEMRTQQGLGRKT